MKRKFGVIRDVMERNLMFKGWLKTKLKKLKAKDHGSKGACTKGLKLIKLKVMLRQIKNLIINKR